jgi:hypothetical protein
LGCGIGLGYGVAPRPQSGVIRRLKFRNLLLESKTYVWSKFPSFSLHSLDNSKIQ